MSFSKKGEDFLTSVIDIAFAVKDAERGIQAGQQNRDALKRLDEQVTAIESERSQRALDQRTQAAVTFESLKFSPLTNVVLLAVTGLLIFKVVSK